MKTRAVACVCLMAAAILAVSAPARADVQVTWKDGLVTIVAKDATVREILAEWARLGQTRIVNSERIAGGPISLELVDVPEKHALDVVLRAVSGYVAAPRAADIPSASRFDRILIFPAPAQPASQVRSMTPAPAAAPVFRPPPRLVTTPDEVQDEEQPFISPAPRPVAVVPPPPAPPLTAPGPAPVTAAPSGSSTPSLTGTRSPGMLLPVPVASPGTQPARF